MSLALPTPREMSPWLIVISKSAKIGDFYTSWKYYVFAHVYVARCGGATRQS